MLNYSTKDRCVNIDYVEKERQKIQASLDALKNQRERNRLGQFSTPTELASDILLLASAGLHNDEKIKFLDPAIGTGSFFSALLSTVPIKRIDRAKGYEIDSHYGMPSQDLWKHTPLSIHLSDFTRAVPPQDKNRYNLIICNPPYVRHHHIASSDKARLQYDCERACGIRMSGLAGLYCYFIGLSHAWMSENGVAAWLIPSEFMDVNYGRQIKQYLLDRVTLLHIHRFDPKEVQFDDALVSSAVVLFRNRPPSANQTIEFTFGGSLTHPSESKLIPRNELETNTKWSSLYTKGVQAVNRGVKIADLFSIRRGLATGANDFFILTKECIAKYNLPLDFLKPILPSPRYIHCDEILTDQVGNPAIDHQLFLLDCNFTEEELRLKYPKLWRYLETGMPAISDRYLCRNRSPWYSQEQRQPAPLLCTYMGRSDSRSGRPFRIILNHSKAIAANVYLMFYPKPPLAHALQQNPKLLQAIWIVLNELPVSTLMDEGRVYGGGLQKIEPGELANVSADSIVALLPKDLYSGVKEVAQLTMDIF